MVYRSACRFSIHPEACKRYYAYKKTSREPRTGRTVFKCLAKFRQHKGNLLVQFPASIHAEYWEEVLAILQTLHELDTTNQWKKAIEFRHETWYTSHTFRMLGQYKATMVLQDMPRCNNLNLQQQFPFYYFRFHGPAGDYRGSYTHEFLEEQAAKMKALLAKGTDVYVYFNNTMGNAFENARYLQQLFKR